MMDNVSKATLGLEARRPHKPATTGTMRNPVLQAKIMNGAGVELKVLAALRSSYSNYLKTPV